jgi:glycine cleavage system aminomethyltransferase T
VPGKLSCMHLGVGREEGWKSDTVDFALLKIQGPSARNKIGREKIRMKRDRRHRRRRIGGVDTKDLMNARSRGSTRRVGNTTSGFLALERIVESS